MKENQLYIQQQQVEKLKDLGVHLRQLREQQSVSLDDVAAKTRIQARLLKAIEEARIEELPEPIYIQGFIKQYASALGLNGKEFSKDFPTSRYVLPSIRPYWQHLSGAQLRPVHLYLLYVFLIFCAVNGLSYLLNRSVVQANNIQGYQQRSPQQAAVKAKEIQITSLEKLGPVLPQTTTKLASNGKPVRVGVTLQARSWLRVVADGKTLFEGDLPKGAQLSWGADEQLTVRAGDAGNVLVAVNDGKAEKMGAPGKVKEVTFGAKSRS